MLTVQDPAPEHPPPDQPAKTDPLLGVAVKDTWVPLTKAAEQLELHDMPAGLEATTPVPDPAKLTASVWSG
jgi:hypothetical protein